MAYRMSSSLVLAKFSLLPMLPTTNNNRNKQHMHLRFVITPFFLGVFSAVSFGLLGSPRIDHSFDHCFVFFLCRNKSCCKVPQGTWNHSHQGAGGMHKIIWKTWYVLLLPNEHPPNWISSKSTRLGCESQAEFWCAFCHYSDPIALCLFLNFQLMIIMLKVFFCFFLYSVFQSCKNILRQ